VDILEERLTQLICKSELREEMSRNSVEYARSYTWDVIAPQITELYRKFIKD
jgi:glycosyltransferase involved in cell wall biosynthesis